MKTQLKKLLVILIVLSGQVYTVPAQDEVGFAYDAAGNRTVRFIPIRSPKPENKESKEALTSNEAAPEKEFNASQALQHEIGEQVVSVCPNPTTGHVVIQVTNLPENEKTSVSVYDMNGKEILKQTNLSEYTSIDITNSPAGNYVMKVFVGSKISDWKILKE